MDWWAPVVFGVCGPALVGVAALRRFLRTPDTSTDLTAAAADQRRWQVSAGAGEDANGEGALLKVVSYNVLAGGSPGGFWGEDDGMYHYLAPRYRVMAARCPRIARELKSYGADVIGLQEIQEGVLENGFGMEQEPGGEPPFMAKAKGELPTLAGRIAGRQFAGIYNPRLTIHEVRGWKEVRPATRRNGDALLVRRGAWQVEDAEVKLFNEAVLPFLEGLHASGLLPELQEALALVQLRYHDFKAACGRGAPGAKLADFIRSTRWRYDGATIALLQHEATGRSAVVVTTHLFWNPRFPQIKAMQAALLTQAIRAFADDRSLRLDGDAAAPGSVQAAVPVIITGDFNAQPHVSRDFTPVTEADDAKAKAEGRTGVSSGVYQLLVEGSLPADHPEHPARWGVEGFPALQSALPPLRSAYVVGRGAEPPVTTRVESFSGCLDYILLSPTVGVRSVLDMPYPVTRSDGSVVAGGAEWAEGDARPVMPTTAELPWLPTKAWPSDHLAIGANLVI